MANEYKENKVQRRPFPEGTKIDVILRAAQSFSGPHSQANLINEGDYAGHLEVIGTEVGNPITDWKLIGELGDVLAYRKHEESADVEE